MEQASRQPSSVGVLLEFLWGLPLIMDWDAELQAEINPLSHKTILIMAFYHSNRKKP